MARTGIIYIAAVDEGVAFNPAVHRVHDWDAVEYELGRQDENSFWTCEVELANSDGAYAKPSPYQRVIISEDVYDDQGNMTTELVFIGRIQSWPIGQSDKSGKMLVTGKPPVVYTPVLATNPAPAYVPDANGVPVYSPTGTYTAQNNILGNPPERYDATRVIHSNANLIALLVLKNLGIEDDPWFLFHDRTEPDTPERKLAARSALLHWTRDDTYPVLADLVQGDGAIDIGAGFIEGSLSLDQPGAPIYRVDVTLKAEWLNALTVRVAFGGLLGTNGVFGTLMPPDWSKFPQVGAKIGSWTTTKAGVALVSTVAGPTLTVDAGDNPGLSAGDDSGTRQIAFQLFNYSATLEAASMISANRRETVLFSLGWGGQDLTGYSGTIEKVDLQCKNLRDDTTIPDYPGAGQQINQGAIFKFEGGLFECNTSHVSAASLYEEFDFWDPLLIDSSPVGGESIPLFFGAPKVISAITPSGNIQEIARNTIPGMTAISFALNQARAKMILGNRIIRASFDVPWADVRSMTGRELVTITDPSIPGGTMTGKVVAVSAQLIKGVAKLTIAAAPGTGRSEPVINQPQYAGIVPALQTVGVVSASIVNDYTVQEAAISQAANAQDVHGVLEQLKTAVDIRLAPTGGTAEYPIVLNLGSYFLDVDEMVNLG